MLRALRRFWENYTASIPKTEVVDSVPESQWDQPDLLPTLSKAKRKAFAELLAIAFSHLPPDKATVLVERGANLLTRSDEVSSALRTALMPEDAEGEPTNLGFIACDWKATEEVQWQADLLCQAHGTAGHWTAPGLELLPALLSFNAWLQQQGRSLLCFSDGDSLVAFAVRPERAASAIALGKKLKLAIGQPDEA